MPVREEVQYFRVYHNTFSPYVPFDRSNKYRITRAQITKIVQLTKIGNVNARNYRTLESAGFLHDACISVS